MATDADRMVGALTRISSDELRTLNVVDGLLAIAKSIDKLTAEVSAISYALGQGVVFTEGAPRS